MVETEGKLFEQYPFDNLNIETFTKCTEWPLIELKGCDFDSRNDRHNISDQSKHNISYHYNHSVVYISFSKELNLIGLFVFPLKK